MELACRTSVRQMLRPTEKAAQECGAPYDIPSRRVFIQARSVKNTPENHTAWSAALRTAYASTHEKSRTKARRSM